MALTRPRRVRACSPSHALLSQNWKARLSAYTDLIARFGLTTSDTDPFFRLYISCVDRFPCHRDARDP